MTHPNGWEAVTAGPTGRHCLDRRVEYWRKRLPDGSVLIANGIAWAHHGRRAGGGIEVLAAGTSGTLAAAKKAAEAAAQNTNTTRTP